MLNIDNEFRQPVSIDFAPAGSVCEWCGKPAAQALIVLGGRSHNDGGYFCSVCGKEFIMKFPHLSVKVVVKAATACPHLAKPRPIWYTALKSGQFGCERSVLGDDDEKHMTRLVLTPMKKRVERSMGAEIKRHGWCLTPQRAHERDNDD
jgi:hypothetical protein